MNNMTYSANLELSQARAEYMAMKMYEEENDLAEWAEYTYQLHNDRMAEAMMGIEELESEQFLSFPSREREDLELAARLREVAEQLERKWK